jgi:glutamyl-tRNA synthetase
VLQQHANKTTIKTRLAPTPSGYLHLGNVLSFAITWALARSQGGLVVLRIDNLDNSRFRPEYLQDIFDTLEFMGIDFDEGPRNPADFHLHYSQHLRLPCYYEMLDQLAQQDLLYACPCSRKQIEAVSPRRLYPLTCRHAHLPLQTPNAAWRIRIPEDMVITFHDQLLGTSTVPLAEAMPDFVVRRKDGIPAYQLASLSDDLQMGVNLIVRGEDLLPSTAAQLLLAQQTGATDFTNAQFVHHPLLRTSDGSKLSKSDGALSVTEMRRAGLKPEELWRKLAYMVGWHDADITTAQGFLERFDLSLIPKQMQ